MCKEEFDETKKRSQQWGWFVGEPTYRGLKAGEVELKWLMTCEDLPSWLRMLECSATKMLKWKHESGCLLSCITHVQQHEHTICPSFTLCEGWAEHQCLHPSWSAHLCKNAVFEPNTQTESPKSRDHSERMSTFLWVCPASWVFDFCSHRVSSTKTTEICLRANKVSTSEWPGCGEPLFSAGGGSNHSFFEHDHSFLCDNHSSQFRISIPCIPVIHWSSNDSSMFLDDSLTLCLWPSVMVSISHFPHIPGTPQLHYHHTSRLSLRLSRLLFGSPCLLMLFGKPCCFMLFGKPCFFMFFGKPIWVIMFHPDVGQNLRMNILSNLPIALSENNIHTMQSEDWTKCFSRCFLHLINKFPD